MKFWNLAPTPRTRKRRTVNPFHRRISDAVDDWLKKRFK